MEVNLCHCLNSFVRDCRATKTSSTLIDLVFTNAKENLPDSGVIHLGISDHSLIIKIELRISDFQHFHWLAGHRLS